MKKHGKTIIYILTLTIIISGFLGLYTLNSKKDYEKYIEVSYTVQAGDTLWKIAKENLPKEFDKRGYIYEIQQINDMDGTDYLKIGEEILILQKGEK